MRDDMETTDRDAGSNWNVDDSDRAALDENARPGLLDGPVIPPVALAGPNVGTEMGLGSALGGGLSVAPIAAVPVLEHGRVEEGRLANPFTPADPSNSAPFVADIPSSTDLPSHVEAELANDGRMAGANIVVILNDGGVITLSGTAPSEGVSADAARVAARVPGVRRVDNHLQVETDV